MKNNNFKFRKEIFNKYNLLGKIVYLFSITTKINIKLRDIYLKGAIKGILLGNRPSKYDNEFSKYFK